MRKTAESQSEKSKSEQKIQSIQILPDADEELTDEEYYQKYLADGRMDSETLVQEQEAFAKAVQSELRLETSREQQRLESDPSLAGQEPSPEVLDRILVGMEVIREREDGTEATGEAASDLKTEVTGEAAPDLKAEAVDEAASGLKAEAAGEAASGLKTEAAGEVSSDTKTEAAEKAAYNPEAYLTKEDLRALEIGRRRLHKPKRRRIRRALAAAAAVFVCILVVSVSSEANRVRIVNAFYVLIGKEAVIRINNDEANLNEYSLREVEARAEIEEKVGIKPVQFMYNTKYLIFDGYEISTSETKWACLFYQYQDTIFTVYMEKEQKGAARGEFLDGEILETFSVDTKIGEVQIMELDADMENKYATEFMYDNTYYKIFGALPREEFVKIVESLFF